MKVNEFRKFKSEVTVQWSICVCKLIVIGFIDFLFWIKKDKIHTEVKKWTSRKLK